MTLLPQNVLSKSQRHGQFSARPQNDTPTIANTDMVPIIIIIRMDTTLTVMVTHEDRIHLVDQQEDDLLAD